MIVKLKLFILKLLNIGLMLRLYRVISTLQSKLILKVIPKYKIHPPNYNFPPIIKVDNIKQLTIVYY